MHPAGFRKPTGFLALCTSTLALFSASPALSAPLSEASIASAAPYAIALGAAGFGIAATLMAAKWRRIAETAHLQSTERLGAMRAALDDFETLVSGMPEVSIIWKEAGLEPLILGPVGEILPGETRPEAILDFRAWLEMGPAKDLAERLTNLRIDGRTFEISVPARDGRVIRAAGRLIGGTAVMRLRPSGANIEPPLQGEDLTRIPSLSDAQAILANLTVPAWLRDQHGLLVYTNAAYLHFTRTLGLKGERGTAPDIFDIKARDAQLRSLEDANDTIAITEEHDLAGTLDIVLFPLSGGSAGYCYPPQAQQQKPEAGRSEPDLGHLTTVIDALATPVAVFDKSRRLTHYNSAYAEFWGLDPDWLNTEPE